MAWNQGSLMGASQKAGELGITCPTKEKGYLNLCARAGNLLVTSGHVSDRRARSTCTRGGSRLLAAPLGSWSFRASSCALRSGTPRYVQGLQLVLSQLGRRKVGLASCESRFRT